MAEHDHAAPGAIGQPSPATCKAASSARSSNEENSVLRPDLINDPRLAFLEKLIIAMEPDDKNRFACHIGGSVAEGTESAPTCTTANPS